METVTQFRQELVGPVARLPSCETTRLQIYASSTLFVHLRVDTDLTYLNFGGLERSVRRMGRWGAVPVLRIVPSLARLLLALKHQRQPYSTFCRSLAADACQMPERVSQR